MKIKGMKTTIDDNSSEAKLNRAQRRAQAKQQRKLAKQIEKYIAKHPEAIKVEIDEEAIQELEAQEQENNEIAENNE